MKTSNRTAETEKRFVCVLDEHSLADLIQVVNNSSCYSNTKGELLALLRATTCTNVTTETNFVLGIATDSPYDEDARMGSRLGSNPLLKFRLTFGDAQDAAYAALELNETLLPYQPEDEAHVAVYRITSYSFDITEEAI